SQACSACGHVSSENRKTQYRFECVVCGFAENADLNAALNIEVAGQAISAFQVNGATRPSAKGTRRSYQHHGVSDAVGIPRPLGRGGCQKGDRGSQCAYSVKSCCSEYCRYSGEVHWNRS
ncbi:MAG: transposase, partial [Chlorobium sp.]|nr:transposase [Chlorobium sp.]